MSLRSKSIEALIIQLASVAAIIVGKRFKINSGMSEFEDLAAVPKIQVLVRKRPLTSRELKKNEADIVRVLDENTIVLAEVK